MDFLYRLLGTPLGWVMWLCYQITKNYGVSLLLFTLIMRGIMVPISLKQQKSTAKMTAMQPELQELQKKYANNKEKLAEEMNKLYQREGSSPMSGCLPMLIQMPVLFGLIDVVYRPLKHILRLPVDIITGVEEVAFKLNLVPTLKGLNHAQIKAIQSIREGVGPWLENGVSQGTIDSIRSLNMDFLGMNLGIQPEFSMFRDILHGQFNPLLLIPILSGISALAMSLISMRTASASGGENPAANSMKGMMLMMPLFSFYIAFKVPAGVGLYWFYSNLFGLIQSLILNKYYNPREMAEKAKQEMAERQERERLERIEAKKRAKKRALETGMTEDDEKAMTQKELNRKKLAEARRRDAEKYGEVYVEVNDDDLR